MLDLIIKHMKTELVKESSTSSSATPTAAPAQPADVAGSASAPANTSQPGPARALLAMKTLMRRIIIQKLEPLISPFTEFDSGSYQMVLATLLDPRFCRGQLIAMATNMADDHTTPPKQRKTKAKELLCRLVCNSHIVIYVMCTMFSHHQ